MPKGRYATEISQKISFTMDPELFGRVRAYHEAVDRNRLASETYRELLWIAVLGNDPLSGTLVASRIIGMRKAQAFVLSEINTFLRDLTVKMRRLAGEADANALAEAQLAVQEAVRKATG